VFVGFTCSNRCAFCAQGELRRGAFEHDITAELDAVESGSVVMFIGGEPTLHDTLPTWVERARARAAAEVVVQTNGRRLASPGYAEMLAAAGVTRLDVSLHGSTAPMHDFHSGVAGSFEETTGGLRHACDADLATGVTTVVTRSNFRHLAEIVQLAASLGAQACHFSLVQKYGKAAERWIAPSAALLRPYWTDGLAVARQAGLPCYAGRHGGADAELGARWFAGVGVVDRARTLERTT
jgi:MoaA/NifB/PqqE/SkfB family radical SAM enzyme